MKLRVRGRSRVIDVLLFAALAVAGPIPAFAAETHQFDVSAEDATTAIRDFATQAHVQILVAGESVGEKQLHPVSGKFSTQEGLGLLLADSGLSPQYVGDRSIALVKASGMTSPADGNAKEGQKSSSGGLRLAQVDQGKSSGASLVANRTTNSPEYSDNASSGLGEIIVTARKQQEKLQDVPLTVTALSGERLSEVGAADVKDVLGTVPGLSYSNVERGLSRYAIRGIASNVASPTVGLYLDDISLVTQATTFTGAFDAILFDMDHIEVLKGPQGTLYGGSAMGGAIKYVSAAPDLTKETGFVSAGASATQHGDPGYKTAGVFNMPLISDVLAVRGGISYMHDGGYINNVSGLNAENTGLSGTPAPNYSPLFRNSLSTAGENDYNSADTYVGKLSLLWQPNDSLRIRPQAIYQNYDEKNPDYFFLNLPSLTSSYRYNSQPTIDNSGIYSLDVRQSLGPVEITSLTGYFDRELSFNRDYSFFVNNNALPNFYTTNSYASVTYNTKTFSQELRVASAPAPDRRLSWVGGLYVSNQNEKVDNADYSYDLGFPDDTLFHLLGTSSVHQKAAFGQLAFRPMDALELTAGVRVFEIDVKSGGVYGGGLISPVDEPVPQLESKEHGVTPRFGLSWKVTDQNLIYTSAAKGFRPGGPATPVEVVPGLLDCSADLIRLGIDPNHQPTQIKSDSLWTYELGSKNELGNDRMTLNGALFYSNWKDIQQNNKLPTCGDSITINAGQARVQGVEVETEFQLTKALHIGANATYTDATIVDPATFNFPKKGDRILDTPAWMGSAFVRYNVPMNSGWDLSMDADYQVRSNQRRLYDPTQLAKFPAANGTYGSGGSTLIPYGAVFEPGYGVANAYVSLQRGPTSFKLFAHNLTDQQPLLDTNLSVGVSRSTTIRPRTIGVEVLRAF
jgi:iron complex outermembrane recepter protein